jgi:hypothetical protein
MKQTVRIPYLTSRPAEKYTDSCSDLHIGLDRTATFIGEMLVGAHLFEQQGLSVAPFTPELHYWFGERHLNYPGPIPTPEISIEHQSLNDTTRELPRALYYTAITQLVSEFEIYLGSLAREVYLYNPSLLAVEEKQLSSAELIELGTYDRIVQELTDRAVNKLVMLSYPNLVQRFNREFHVGIHHSDSPASLFDIHHMIEQRNIIVHNNGYSSPLYLERMAGYNNPDVLKPHRSVRPDFLRFYAMLDATAALCDYVDARVREKWNTSAT